VSPLDHPRRKIDPNRSTVGGCSFSGQHQIDPGAASEVHDHITGFNIGETDWVSAPSGQIEGYLRHIGEIRGSVQSLIDRIARTGLSLARSTRLPVAATLGKRPVSGFDGLLYFRELHLRPPCAYRHGAMVSRTSADTEQPLCFVSGVADVPSLAGSVEHERGIDEFADSRQFLCRFS
jgi:hypothetical protein|tara:strand:+ start:435 stop:968 length:534 start_codon:yes stop_codon:yes gene_type:complete